ncbi:hypothetical protein [Caldiplasma sukawensis]
MKLFVLLVVIFFAQTFFYSLHFNQNHNQISNSFHNNNEVPLIGSSSQGKIPSNIRYQVPLYIVNNQSEPTVNGFQQLVDIQHDLFSPYLNESGSLANFEFFYTNGTIIPSWIESFNSTVTVVYVKLYSIPANSSLKILLGFAAKNVNLLSSSGTEGIGEAPQLSPLFGEYDDGSSVFLWYNNGQTISGYSYINGSEGLGLTSTTDPYGQNSSVLTLTPDRNVQSNPTPCDTVAWYDSPVVGNDFIMEGWVHNSIPGNYNVFFALDGSSPKTDNNFIFGSGWQNYGSIIDYIYGGCYLSDANSAKGKFPSGWAWNEAIVNGTSLHDKILSAPQSTGGTLFYSSNYTASNYNYSDKYIGYSTYTYAGSPVYYFTSFIRDYPLNGKMPSVIFSLQSSEYNVTFNKTGLPTGTSWSVSVNGVNYSSSSSSITVKLLNGTYNYNSNTVDTSYIGYGGSFTVNGSSLIEQVHFLELYKVTFNETGLPPGTNWYVNLSNGMSSGPINGSSYTFHLPNGTYNLKFATSDKEYSAYWSYFVKVFYHNQLTSITVNGSSLSNTVKFYIVKYLVSFRAVGLPSSARWYVNSTQVFCVDNPGNEAVSLFLENGTYNYTVSTTDKIYHANGGSFTVNGSSLSMSIKFSQVNYSVTFVEMGLMSGTPWYVNLSNGMSSGPINGSSYTFSLINGSYSYTIGTVDKTHHSNGGTITVNGSSESFLIRFSQFSYSLTFVEKGLPSGTTWSVNINGENVTSSNSTITIYLINGTYSYQIVSISGYTASSNGTNSFNISGKPVNFEITFTKNFTISQADIYIIIISVIVVISVAAFVIFRVRKPKVE